MKMPHFIRTYCPSCRKHTTQEIEKYKKRKASELRMGQRRFRRVLRGYGSFPRAKPTGREKPTKRIQIMFRCKECKKATQRPCIRAKKFEVVET